MKEIGYTHGGARRQARPSSTAGLRSRQAGSLRHVLRCPLDVRGMSDVEQTTMDRKLARGTAAAAVGVAGRAPAVERSVSRTWSPRICPRRAKTWEASKPLRGRALRQARRAGPGHPPLHLVLARAVAKGYALALLIGTPLGFLLGLSKISRKGFDPIIQILRPVSPLAWLPLGLVLFENSEAGGALHHRDLRHVAHGAQHRRRRARRSRRTT